MIIVFIIICLVFLLLFYLFRRGWQAIPAGSPWRIVFAVVFPSGTLAFIAGRILERIGWVGTATVLVWVGSFWLALMLYFTLGAVLVDLLRLLHRWFHIFPAAVTANLPRARLIALGATLAVTALVVSLGFWNARNPQVRRLAVTIPKAVEGRTSLRIALASDIHLGILVGNSLVDDLVTTVTGLKPDLILLPGDIVDEDLEPVIRQDLGRQLLALRAPLGVYACTGNHEYIGGAEPAVRYLEAHGIRVLRDEAVALPGGIWLAGREDRMKGRFTGAERKPLAEVLRAVDRARPVILMDHQPFRLDDATRHGVDLQVSGHTHHGQLWPLSLITRSIYPISYGYGRIGGTQVYVSCGFGTWGPPVRVGNRPEIVLIEIAFSPQS
ncbi:MAG TPA: metallophosphoesterase [Acidobacteriota bacterium]|nr:metallophosphoesterase [Acidobacteriota bacterium]HQM64073.1 metallophosphoesterase [Acidobacteriota bacterium]